MNMKKPQILLHTYKTSLITQLLLMLTLCFCQTSAFANTPRLALVIGNGSYEEAPLKNPINDAADMASVLKRVGFEVTHLNNLDGPSMNRSIWLKYLKVGY